MKKRNISVLTIIFFTLLLTVLSVMIATDVKNKVVEMGDPAARKMYIQYFGFVIVVGLTALIIILQALRLIERKSEIEKYDIPLAMMNKYAEQVKIQQNKNELYAAIMQALAYEYESVYFVDTETEDYLKYVRTDDHDILWLDRKKRYFFTELLRYLMKTADKKDIKGLTDQLSKNNMLAVLADNKVFSVRFRSVRFGVTNYYVLCAVNFVNARSNHIVVGLKNINASIQSESEYKAAVGQAIEMAVIDELTGVKNRNAYVKYENELDQRLEDDGNTDIAVVVLDVNGLKHVNDTMGHSAGDDLLRTASALICEMFAGNDIYRIGGDEFAIVLLGDAYNERDSLLQGFRDRILENMSKGEIVIASGMAEFIPGVDEGIESVFDKADAEMYINKKELKSL